MGGSIGRREGFKVAGRRKDGRLDGSAVSSEGKGDGSRVGSEVG